MLQAAKRQTSPVVKAAPVSQAMQGRVRRKQAEVVKSKVEAD